MSTKISELTAATVVEADDVLPMVRDGSTVKVSRGILSGPVCAVNASASPTYDVNQGFSASITRNGAGDYTLTLSQSYTLASVIPVACLATTAAGSISVSIASSSTFRVRTWDDSNVAADLDFHLICAFVG